MKKNLAKFFIEAASVVAEASTEEELADFADPAGSGGLTMTINVLNSALKNYR